MKFVVLPNDLSPAPWKFTKLTKLPFSMLRMQAYTVAMLIDDIIVIDQSFEGCLLLVVETINLLQKLAFLINPDKNKFSQNRGISWFHHWIRKNDNLSIGSEKPKKFMGSVGSFQQN